MKDKAITDIEETFKECYEAQGDMLSEFEEDDKFYLGDQWGGIELNQLLAMNRPVITINQVFKPVNLVTGYYRQNKMDLKYYPVEGGDQQTADIYTETAKWIVENCGGRENMAFSFGDCARVGMGWINLEMDYSEDPINGDIRIGSGDKYHFMFDPYMKDPTLLDCDYILRYAWISKDKAINIYPDREKDIKKIKTGDNTRFTTQIPGGTYDRGTRINIIEKWYREWQKMTVIIDPVTLESYEWKGEKRKFKLMMEQVPDLSERILLLDVKVPKIKLRTEAEGEVLLHDGEVPEGYINNQYPFIPMFCYYVPNFDDWTYKVQGIIRSMRDPQREYNKMRSIIMDSLMRQPDSGWIYRAGVVADPSQLDKTGAGVKIEVNQGGLGDGLWPVTPPQFNVAFAQLQEMYGSDMTRIGPNADMLGMIGNDANASSADASGASLQLRTKQGLMSLQNPFDGAALSHRLLGKALIPMINKWSKEKIERIIGRRLPQNWDKIKNSARFDCIVDTQASSPTYKMAVYAQLQGYVQHGIQIPQSVLREASDIPFKLKQEWAQVEQQQMQQALQDREYQKKLEMAKLQIMADSPVKAKQVELEGKKVISAMDNEAQKDIEMMDNINKIAVEKLKNKE